MQDLLKIEHHYWSAYQPVQDLVKSIASSHSFVVEIGPGRTPFPLAHEFVDWQILPAHNGKTVHCLDINVDPLPYEDKSVDFIYCRHTLEDIYNPFWVCQEMSRIAKAGYIETPSPVAEFCRGVDGRQSDGSLSVWRGYHHHRYFVWNQDNILFFVPKYSILEYFNFAEEEASAVEILNSSPLYWNTYFFWDDRIDFKLLQHDRDFDLTQSYASIILNAVQVSVENNLEFSFSNQLSL